MLKFIIGLLCGAWIYRLFKEYQARRYDRIFLSKFVDRVNKANKGRN